MLLLIFLIVAQGESPNCQKAGFESCVTIVSPYLALADLLDDMQYEKDNDIEFDPQHHPYGKPLSIMSISDEAEVQVDSDALDRIFIHPEIVNRKIVVISIVGALRKGKSFFLDYCLRFLYANVSFSVNY